MASVAGGVGLWLGSSHGKANEHVHHVQVISTQ